MNLLIGVMLTEDGEKWWEPLPFVRGSSLASVSQHLSLLTLLLCWLTQSALRSRGQASGIFDPALTEPYGGVVRGRTLWGDPSGLSSGQGER
jgi:hypothetical protein